MKPLMLALAAALFAIPASAKERSVEYTLGDAAYEGYLAMPKGDPQGLVLMIHDWDGLTAYERVRARMLTRKGYAVFAADLYGKGNRPDTVEAKKAEIGKLYNDREAMRARILKGLEIARAESGLSEAVAMGYCFGGAAVLELARSGAAEDISGYATFHGGLATPEGQDYSKTQAPVLIMHGGADSGIPMSQVAEVFELMEQAGVEYEIEVYSGAPHAWTVFGSDRYRAKADEKSWDAFGDFLEETLKPE